ncbi:MAG: glycosyltransferase [Acidobacteriota bacterium]
MIIPTYNRREFLAQAVASVRAQTFQDWELIVVDDGSDDGSAGMLESLDDPRIRLIRQPRQGVSAARNRGIRAARHPWIALLDSDDQWQPSKLERQITALQAAPEYRLTHSDEIWIRRGRRVNPKKIHRKYGGWIYHRCLPLCVISPSSVLLQRSLLDEVGCFDEEYPVCEDYELWLRICCRSPVLFLEEPLTIKYGGHSDQLSRSRWGLDRYRLQALLKIYRSGRLTPQQKAWTAHEIVRKAEILATGFGKRGKSEEAGHYRRIAGDFAHLAST